MSALSEEAAEIIRRTQDSGSDSTKDEDGEIKVMKTLKLAGIGPTLIGMAIVGLATAGAGPADGPSREETLTLAALLGALVLLIAGGVLSGGTIVSLFEGEAVDLGSAAVLFLVGICLIAVAFLVVRRQT
jgi:hypothetical protein